MNEFSVARQWESWQQETVKWQEIGEIIMINWNIRECPVPVNLPFLIWQVRLPIQGIPNPIRHILHLIFHISSYYPYWYHLSSSLSHAWSQLGKHLRIRSEVSPLHIFMPWLLVCTECSIGRVQHSPSTEFTKYWIHQVQHTPSTAYTAYSLHQAQHTPSTAYTTYSIHQVQHTLSAAYTKYTIHEAYHSPKNECVTTSLPLFWQLEVNLWM